MTGVYITTPQVMQVMLPNAAQKALSVQMKDIMPSSGKNNHPWDPLLFFKLSKEFKSTSHILIKLRVVCECTLQ